MCGVAREDVAAEVGWRLKSRPWLRSSRATIASGFSPRSTRSPNTKLRRSDADCASPLPLQYVAASQLCREFGQCDLWFAPQAIRTPLLRSESQLSEQIKSGRPWLRSSLATIASGFRPRSTRSPNTKLRRSDVDCASPLPLQYVAASQLCRELGHATCGLHHRLSGRRCSAANRSYQGKSNPAWPGCGAAAQR